MHSRPAVMDHAYRPKDAYGGGGRPAGVIKLKRGGPNKNSNSGPSGKEKRPAAMRYKALAEMAASHRKARRS